MTNRNKSVTQQMISIHFSYFGCSCKRDLENTLLDFAREDFARVGGFDDPKCIIVFVLLCDFYLCIANNETYTSNITHCRCLCRDFLES